MTVFLGVDIGQRHDPTAVCVAELETRSSVIHYVVRHLERLPLGTPYPDVVRRIGEITARVEHRTHERPVLFVDATGVGKPIVDLLRAGPVGAGVVPVSFVHGIRRRESNGEVRLGKAYLVGRLQALLRTRRIHLPRTSEARALFAELLDYEIRVDENANDRYGAFRVGTHDDLATALGLAVQIEGPASGCIGTVRAQRS